MEPAELFNDNLGERGNNDDDNDDDNNDDEEEVEDVAANILAEQERARQEAQIQILMDQLAGLRAAQGNRSPTTRNTGGSSVVGVQVHQPPSTFSELIGDFLPVERSEIDLEHSSMQVLSRTDRDRLSASDKNKIYLSFVKGITSKFKATSTVVGLDDVSTIDNIISFAQLRLELQKHITSVSAHSVFLILKFDVDGQFINPDTPLGKPINLLSTNILPPIAQIEQSTFYHYRRGSSFNQQNLSWTFEAIRNSCDKDLQAMLDAKMLKYKPSERFGPLLYYELVLQMTDVDSKAVRAITQEFSSLKVTDHDGQSIAKVAKIIRSTIIWLEMVQMLPPDIDAIVVDILETCTVPDFLLFFKTLCANANLNGIKLTAEALLVKSEEHYRVLILSKRWDAIGHQGSTFNASNNRVQRSTPNSKRNRVPLPPWNRTAPTGDEPHEREFETRVFKWCGVCERWFYGDRGHFTNEHVPGYVVTNRRDRPATSSAPEASANLAAIVPATPAPAGSLSRNYFNGGL